MMLVSVNGFPGAGKTLLLTAFAWMSRGKIPIYSNFNLRMKGATLITIEDLEGIEDGLILIDEAYLWLESRISGSELNRYMSRIVFQSRKRGLDIFTSEQVHGSIDLRFRSLEDLTIYAFGMNNRQTAFQYIFSGYGVNKPFSLPMKTAEKLFPKFDTLEFPETRATIYEPKKYNQNIKTVVNKIYRKYGKKEKLSQNMIKDFMMEKGIYEKNICEGVHARILRNLREVEK